MCVRVCESMLELDALISQFVTEASKNCIARPAACCFLLSRQLHDSRTAPLPRPLFGIVVVALPLRAV